MRSYDCIVVGVGAVGSATLSQLAARGARVLGIDRFRPGHNRGSSHGRTRAIRLAYFEHPDYVPLLRRAFELWRGLNDRASAPLYVETGILEAGPEEGELIPGVLKAADLHSLAIDCLDSAAMKARFGAFRLQPGMRAVFEPIAGYLHVEDCIRHMASEGQSRGAELALDTVVTHWTYDSCEFLVHSDKESWRTKRLILTQGAWATDFLREQGVQLDVVRKMQLWFRASDNRFSSKQGFVPFAIETGEAEVFYGFPELDERGVKVAQHTGGEPVLNPLELDGVLRPSDLAPVVRFAADYLPGVSSHCLAHEACMYTRSPDEHFIIDGHADFPGLTFAAGLSGHGFKFVPVLGEALAELALDEGTELPIGFLSAARFVG